MRGAPGPSFPCTLGTKSRTARLADRALASPHMSTVQQRIELSATDLGLLRACPPLAELTDATRDEVIATCNVIVVPSGTAIIEQDELGEAFYVLLSGTVEVLRLETDGRELRFAELQSGAYFGEQALLGSSLGKRNATVRASRACRCAEIGAEIFRRQIARAGRNAETFERNGAQQAYDRLRRSLEAFASGRLHESAEGVARVAFPTDATIIHEGEPSDAAFLILSGVAVVVQHRNGATRELARIAAGQIIGELGVLHDKPRAATVLAENDLAALRIEAGAFRAWHAAHPGSTQFFDSLAQVYTLPQSRRLSVFLGDVDGQKSITTVRGEPTSGVVSTRILERGVVVFANAGADEVTGDREAVAFADGPLRRELRVIVKSRKNSRIESCVIHGVAAEGVGADLGELYHRVALLDTLTALDLRRFVRTGYLGGDAKACCNGLEGKICPCLGIGASEMSAAIEEVGTDFDSLRTAIGVGTLCGGCEPAGRSFISRTTGPWETTATTTTAPIALAETPPPSCPAHHGKNLTLAPGPQAEPPPECPAHRAKTPVPAAPPPSCPAHRGATPHADAPPASCPAHHGQALAESGYPLRRIQNLLASWHPPGDARVRREDVALRFRGLGVRDMDAFLDTLFPGVLPPNQSVPVPSLLEAITRVMDFDDARLRHGPSYPTRVKSSEPVSPIVRAREAIIRFVLRHRHAALAVAGVAAIVLLGGTLRLASAAGPLALGATAIAATLLVTGLGRNRSVRYIFFILQRGESRIYSAMFSAFGSATKYATFRPLGPFGPTVFYIRSEEMVEQVLNRPRDYVRDSRFPLDTYSPFGVKSLLWGGVDGYWLGYRSVCEEYFVTGYESDLPEMAEIVRERVRTWAQRGEIDLLKEIYRIVLEIRARIFFQTTFHCFDDAAALDFADLIDRVLSGKGFFYVDHRDAALLHARVMEAVRGATRPGSVGHSLRQCLESGDLEPGEVLHNAVMYVLAQAPTMALFWTLYRAAHLRTTATLRGDRREIVRAIKEEMRLHPPVTSLFFRTAARDTVIDGVAIPQGSPIFVCPFLIQTNPAHWTNPEKFDANRWTSAAGVAKEIVEPKTDASDSRTRPTPRPHGQPASRHLPFGAGAHACQGRWFASDEMLLVVDNVLAMVDLEILDDQGLFERPLADQVTLHVYSRPRNEVRLKVVPLAGKNN